jgi:alpha-1,2-mannosyltransferase
MGPGARYLHPFAALVGLVLLIRPTIEGWVMAWRRYPHDGVVDWIVARAFLAGTDPYAPAALRAAKLEGLGHPPTTGFWMLPFAGYSLADMSVIYGHVVLVLVFAWSLLMARQLRWPWPTLTAALVFVAVAGTGWFKYQLALAQIGALIAAAYVVAWALLRSGRDVAAGVALGLACTIKLHPGLVVLFLLLSGRFRAVAAACAAYLAVFALMTSRLGLDAWGEYVVSEKAVVNTWLGHPHNASLQGIIVRAFSPACLGRGVPSPAVTALSLALSVGLCLGAWWLSRSAWKGKGESSSAPTANFDLGYALVVALSVFLNPFTFEHYFLQLVLPTAIAITALVAARRAGLSAPSTVAGALAVAAIGVLLAIDPFTQDRYSWTKDHLQRHAFEVLNWLHIVVLLGLLGGLLAWFNRRRPGVPALAPGGSAPAST